MKDLTDADSCVKCGLCLPHCPTYAITANEADSPRGRIALIQALADPDTALSPGLLRHLDGCLSCSACEAMCPSKVPFGALLDTARARIEPQRKRTPVSRMMRRLGLSLVTLRPTTLRPLVWALKSYRRSGLQGLLQKTGLLRGKLRRLDQMLVRDPRWFVAAEITPPENLPEKSVLHLFRGCVSATLDSEAVDAAIVLLSRLGYEVHIPDGQTCCGALHQHTGDCGRAEQLATTNIRAFGEDKTEKIISLASGCCAQLRNYPQLYPNSIEAAFASRVVDIQRFLLQDSDLAQLTFRPLEATVMVQQPCTQRNVLREPDSPQELLTHIPAINIKTLDTQNGCCGAAGGYFLTQPEMADQLRDKLLADIGQTPPDYLVSNNIGCALHLQAEIQARGWKTEVLHPLTLLARQLDTLTRIIHESPR